MSIQYDKEILKTNNLILKVNFSGIRNSVVSATDLKMSVYAYSDDGQPKFSETLNFDQIKSLYDHLHQITIIKDSSKAISGKFIETTEEVADILNKLNNVDANVLKVVFSKLNEDEKINDLFSALSEIEDDAGNSIIEILSNIQTYQEWQTEIENLNKLLQLEEEGNIVDEIIKLDSLKSYLAGQPEKIFQNWIEKNIKWIFGVEYINRYDFRKIAFLSEGDLLMESMDGYLDLIELKRPRSDIFTKIDESHKSYYASTDLSKVLGQCLLYLQKIDDFKLNIEKEYKVKILRPRVKIIIGRTKNFNEEQFNALRMLNSNLSHIQVISYDYLLSCGKKMIENYKRL